MLQLMLYNDNKFSRLLWVLYGLTPVVKNRLVQMLYKSQFLLELIQQQPLNTIIAYISVMCFIWQKVPGFDGKHYTAVV